MAFFEAAIFNRDVRDLVNDFQHHEFLDDVWAELNFIEIEARTKQEAMDMLRRKYPDRNGYEITQIVELPE